MSSVFYHDKCKLRDIKIRYADDKGYLMTGTYRCEDEHGNVDIVSVLDVPIPMYERPVIRQEFGMFPDNYTIVNFGFGELVLSPESRFVSQRIHTATKEMTMEEIEAALGYSVKIVAEKEVKEND